MKFFVLVVGGLLSIAAGAWALIGWATGTAYLHDHWQDIATLGGSGVWVAVIGLGIMSIYVHNEHREARRDQLRTSGVTADGVVTAVRPTGTTGNFGAIVVNLDLEVHPPTGQSFRTRLKEQFVVQALPMTGDHLQVVYDPAHPATVMLAKQFDVGISAGIAPKVTRRAAFDPMAIPPVPAGWEIGVRRSLVIIFGLIGLAGWAIALDAILEKPGQATGIYLALGFGGFGTIFGGTAVGAVLRGIQRMRTARREHALFMTGQRATGVITDVDYNPRIVINEVLTRVHFTVTYPGPDGSDLALRAVWLMLMASIPLPGDLVQVAYDPAHPDKPALNTDWNTLIAGGRRMITQHSAAGHPVSASSPAAPAGRPPVVRARLASPAVTVARRLLSRAAIVIGLALVVMGITGFDPPGELTNASGASLVVVGIVVIVMGHQTHDRRGSLGGALGGTAPVSSVTTFGQIAARAMMNLGAGQQAWFANGKRAVATVTDTRQSFGGLNTMNVPVTLSLHVTPADEPAFDAETTLLLAINAIPSPGAKVRVGYNPTDHTMVGLETRAIDTTGGLTVVTQP